MSSNTNPESSTAIPEAVDYTKYIPFVTGVLIYLGVSRLIIFYNLFGLNIISFLDFGEIITSFLDNLISSILTLAIFWALITPINIKGQIANEYLHQKVQYFNKRLLVSLILYSTFVLLLYPSNFKMSILFILTSVGVYTLFIIFILINEKSTSKIVKDLTLITIALVASELTIFYTSIRDYRDIKNCNKYWGTKIVFNNETFLKDSSHVFTSDSSNFYIGKTNNYVFIHDLKKSATFAYPMSNVVQIKFERVFVKNWLGKFLLD